MATALVQGVYSITYDNQSELDVLDSFEFIQGPDFCHKDNWCCDILIGFFCTRTNMEIDAALALFFEALAFLVMSTYPTFAMRLHENH